MKRMLKRKERPASHKIGLTQKRRFFKRIKNAKEKNNQINSPHNTSQFLIENNSSPFYEDEDTDIDFIPNSFIILDDSEEIFDDEDSIYQKKIIILLFQRNMTNFGRASTLRPQFNITL